MVQCARVNAYVLLSKRGEEANEEGQLKSRGKEGVNEARQEKKDILCVRAVVVDAPFASLAQCRAQYLVPKIIFA